MRSSRTDAVGSSSFGKRIVTFTINGGPREALIEPHMLVLEVLRDRMGLTGTKRGCDSGSCGACTILVDGAPVCACLTLAISVADKPIRTVEGLASSDGTLHPLQQAFIDNGAAHCGFCTAGMLMTSQALLAANPRPTREEVKLALSGNLCRCTGYTKIVDAVVAAGGQPNAVEELSR